MNSLNQNKIPLIFTSLLYMCGFFIFLEWLYPIKQITDTNEMELFILYAVYSFLISLFQMRWWLSFILKSFGMLFLIHLLFFEQSFLDIVWISELFSVVTYNWEVLINQEWYELTAIFRSLLFLILIWLMSYLIHYWFVIVKRVFLFILLTFVYLSVLDTFTAYDATMSIVRVFVLSFLTLGLTNFFKEVQREAISFKWTKRTSKWLIPILSIVLFSSLVGYAAPKFDPKWPDPVPFIQNAAGTGGGIGTTAKKVGYGEDDSQLGGSFEQDNERVFKAYTKTENYWRVETKDIYTGKGWENDSSDEEEMKVIESNNHIPLTTFSEHVETNEHHALIIMAETFELPKLVYPYGINALHRQDIQLKLNEQNEEIRTTSFNNQDMILQEYSMNYSYPSFDINELKKDGEDPEDIKERYTQLPPNLPDRIEKLAKEIAQPYDTRYDKALAIEKYFGQSGIFTYETENIPVPRGSQDYVDQFLFNSHAGYCDNYSTSMVVMLRTLGIPARWAKGFTSGEKVTENDSGHLVDDGYDVYEITNANAHSWVEVYFSNVGWVPFEPTQGFSNPTDFYTEVVADDDGDDTLDATETEETEPQSQDESLNEEKEEETATPEKKEGPDNEAKSFTLKKWHVGVGAGFLALLIIFAFVKRHHIQVFLLTKKMNRNQDAASLQAAYHFLLKMLDKKGNGKDPQQTLREYAKTVDVLYSGKSMSVLTKDYEQIIYNNQNESVKSSKFAQLWEDLIKDVIG